MTGNAGGNGAAVKIVVGVKADSVTQEISFTASALLDSTVYIKVGGAWKEGQLKINVGGAWK